jgi:hypothetical protein
MNAADILDRAILANYRLVVFAIVLFIGFAATLSALAPKPSDWFLFSK